jgi:hypothetical protein
MLVVWVHGWKMFTNDALSFGEAERPPYMPRYSTAAEFVSYASRAGFSGVAAHKRSPLVIVTAEKTLAAPGSGHSSRELNRTLRLHINMQFYIIAQGRALCLKNSGVSSSPT